MCGCACSQDFLIPNFPGNFTILEFRVLAISEYTPLTIYNLKLYIIYIFMNLSINNSKLKHSD